MKRSRNISGFTLIELMVVVAIIGIMAAIATPLILQWMPNIRFREASREVMFDLQFAKAEAIKRNANVVVEFFVPACPGLPNAVPGSAPPPGLNSYRIFVDDGVGTASDDILNGGEVTLKNIQMPANVALCPSGAALTNDKVSFLPTGSTNGGNAGTIMVANDQARNANISVSIAGNIRFQ